MSKCYITEKECEFYDGEECLAIFPEQCPISQIPEDEPEEQNQKGVKK